MGQGVGGGVRGVALEQRGGGGEQIAGKADMAGGVLGVPAQVQDAAAQVILVRAGQGLVEQPLRPLGVPGQPRRIGRRQPPPRRILWTSRQPSRLFGGPGRGGEPGSP